MNPVARLRWLASHATPLCSLTSELTGQSSVAAFLEGQDLWIFSAEYGCVRIGKTVGDVEIFPVPTLDADAFSGTFVAAWMPQIQHYWGRQVLHASSVVQIGDDKLIAFSGDKECGKSTLAYGLGQREAQQHLGDDMLVFAVPGDVIEIIPYPEAPRLRQTSFDYYQALPGYAVSPSWPETDLDLMAIYVLSPSTDLEIPVRITLLSGAEAYTPLLQQAFNLTLELPDLKRRLFEDYAVLANQTRVFRLEYRQQLDLLPRLLDAVETHAWQPIHPESV